MDPEEIQEQKEKWQDIRIENNLTQNGVKEGNEDHIMELFFVSTQGGDGVIGRMGERGDEGFEVSYFKIMLEFSCNCCIGMMHNTVIIHFVLLV